jgi:hypothetical protein
MFFECPSQESHSELPVTNQTAKIFGMTLQTFARNCNRALCLRRGRLMMMKMMNYQFMVTIHSSLMQLKVSERSGKLVILTIKMQH